MDSSIVSLWSEVDHKAISSKYDNMCFSYPRFQSRRIVEHLSLHEVLGTRPRNCTPGLGEQESEALTPPESFCLSTFVYFQFRLLFALYDRSGVKGGCEGIPRHLADSYQPTCVRLDYSNTPSSSVHIFRNFQILVTESTFHEWFSICLVEITVIAEQ